MTYQLQSPNGMVGKLLVQMNGDEDLDKVSEALADFSHAATSHERNRTLTELRLTFNQTFARGTYTHDDVEGLMAEMHATLAPGAGAWEIILGYIEVAMDQFDVGAQERQDILAFLYLLSGGRPEALVLPAVSFEDGAVVVKHDNVEIHRGEIPHGDS